MDEAAGTFLRLQRKSPLSATTRGCSLNELRGTSNYSDPDESEPSSVASRARKAYGLSPMRLTGRTELLRMVSAAGPTEGGGCKEPHPYPCSIDFRQIREQKGFLQFEHWTLLPTLPSWQPNCPLVQGEYLFS